MKTMGILMRHAIFALILLGCPSLASAKIFYSKESALKLAFPTATKVSRKHVFLTPEQVEAIRQKSGYAPKSKVVTAYVGYQGSTLLGHAFIDTHTVRTMPETFMTVVGPTGKLIAVHILAFHEPQEYMPPDGWLKQFHDRELSNGLQLRNDIAGIAGSTLSATAITKATRQLLVLHQTAFAPSSETKDMAASAAHAIENVRMSQ